MIKCEPDGAVDFSVYLPHAQSVEIVGSFTDRERSRVWLNSTGDGWWVVRLRVPSGEHEFSYLVDDRFYMPDYGTGDPRRTPAGQLVSLFKMRLAPELAPARGSIPGRAAAGGGALSTSARSERARTHAAPCAR